MASASGRAWRVSATVVLVPCKEAFSTACLHCQLGRRTPPAPRCSCRTAPQPAPLQLLREELLATVTSMASTGLRTLCLAYTDFPKSDPFRPADFFSKPHEENLTMLCIVGIKASRRCMEGHAGLLPMQVARRLQAASQQCY